MGDMLDLAAVTAATRDITAAYLTYPIAPGLLEAIAIFAQAAVESGVSAIVNMSQISARRDAASNAARQHWLAGRILDWSPVSVTHLRPTFFAEWLVTDYQPDGTLPLPFGDGRHAPIAAEDQARVITAILEDPAPHTGQVYPLVGLEEMNHFRDGGGDLQGSGQAGHLQAHQPRRVHRAATQARVPRAHHPAPTRGRDRLPQRGVRRHQRHRQDRRGSS